MIRTPPRALLNILLVAALVEGLALAWALLWSSPDAPGKFFGGDQEAYRQAAIRLIETGSPYHPLLFAGPLANVLSNVPIAYVYPPPLAQLFVPLVAMEPRVLAAASSLTQGLILSLLLPLVYRRFAGGLSLSSVLGVFVIGMLSFPVQYAIYGGNMSALVAIAIAVAVLAPGRGGAVAATLVGILKMTPGILLLPALFTRGSRRVAAGVGIVVIGLSVAIAPVAWVDWLRVLPNIVRFPPWDSTHNVAPVVVFGAVNLAALGTAISLIIVAGSVAGAVVLAHRGRWFGSVAAATTALLFGPSSLGDHYLAMLIPLVIAAWPNSGWQLRAILATFIASTIVPWWTPDPSLLLRAGYLAATIGACVGVTKQLARYRSEKLLPSHQPAGQGLNLETGRLSPV